MSNIELTPKVLDNGVISVDAVVNFDRLEWLVHVLPIPKYRLLQPTMLVRVEASCKKFRGGQTKT